MYALIALGYTLVYGVLQLINFAHSEVFMSGAFGSFLVVHAIVGDSHHVSGVATVFAVVAGLLSGAVSGRGRRVRPGTGGLPAAAEARRTETGVPDQCDRCVVLPGPAVRQAVQPARAEPVPAALRQLQSKTLFTHRRGARSSSCRSSSSSRRWCSCSSSTGWSRARSSAAASGPPPRTRRPPR